MSFEKFEFKISWNYSPEPFVSLSKQGQLGLGRAFVGAFLPNHPPRMELYFDTEERSIGMVPSDKKGVKLNYKKVPCATLTLPKGFVSKYEIREFGRYSVYKNGEMIVFNLKEEMK